MKQIITLFLALGVIASVSAQSTRDIEEGRRVILGPKKGSGTTQDPRDIVLGDDRRVYGENGERYPSGTSKDASIDQVNREYDEKIYSIRNNRSLSSAEKERMIRQLEQDRDRRIRQINERYSGNDRRYEDDDYRKGNKKVKNNKDNNGNHYGWEKGKGNPHKGRY